MSRRTPFPRSDSPAIQRKQDLGCLLLVRLRSPARARCGFTLLEVLLTVLVSSVLLMTLWTLLDMYARLFDAGQTKAGQTQLMSGLMRQLSDDLCSAIQDTAEAPPGTLGPVRRFGLFGSAHSMQFDMLQPAPSRVVGAAQAMPESSLDEPLAAEAYELRTVRYDFVPMNDQTQFDASSRPGLTRYELDFKTTSESSGYEEPAAALPEQPQEGPAFDMMDTSQSEESALMESLSPDPNDNTVTWVPEVVALEFRYFDGLAWTSTWNSLQRKSLPAAVEVVMKFSPTEGLTLPKPPAEPAAETDEALGDEWSPLGAEQETARPGTLGCRLVIDLPTSALRNVFDKQRDAFLLPGELEQPQANVDVLMDELFDVDEDEQSPYAFTDEPRGPRGRRPPRPGQLPGSARTVIQQRSPDQWMRGL